VSQGLPPWFRLPDPIRETPRVAVVGAGIAGCATAYALARRGVAVTLIDRCEDVGRETSGNPAGVVLPFLSLKPDPMSRFFGIAYETCHQIHDRLEGAGHELGRSLIGVVHLLAKPRLARLHAAIASGELVTDQIVALTAEEAAERSGLPLEEPALFYPRGGFVVPPMVCRAFADHPRIGRSMGQRVTSLERREGTWHLLNEAGATVAEADVVVLASGDRTGFEAYLDDIPIRRSRGQLMTFPRNCLAHVPKTVICHKGYLVPGPGDRILIGATWRRHEDRSLSWEDHHELIAESRAQIPGFDLTKQPPLEGRVAFRARTPDHLPVVGPLPDWSAYRDAYTGLNHGRHHRAWHAPTYQSGLYATLGHGGRGMVSAPIAGEILAAQILGEPSPVADEILADLHPARFLIRDLARGR